MTFGPYFGGYDHRLQPPDPPEPCCALAEDDPDHDVQACLAEQAEAAAEAKADRQRDEEAVYGPHEPWA